MILENLLNILAINLHKFFKNTRIMAENLRSPNTFFFGFIAKRLMLVGNQKVIEDSVKRLNIKSEDKILEVGSGNGQALIEILKKNPKKIKVIEISPIFRNHLKNKFGKKIEVYENDAKNLKGIINNSSIDKILLINVIYFLNPLELYLKELKRILNKDGTIFIAGKFEAVKTFDDNVFQNKKITELLKVLKKFFKVSYEFVDLGDLNSRYYAIYLKK
jgi:ubiquinone/menaquinone biosynthesis C-methylase UbiE